MYKIFLENRINIGLSITSQFTYQFFGGNYLYSVEIRRPPPIEHTQLNTQHLPWTLLTAAFNLNMFISKPSEKIETMGYLTSVID